MISIKANSEGYLNDQPWTFGYHYSLSPQYLNLALAFAGRDPLDINSYCELAFGHGVSLAIHAAANPKIRFAGTDFNPQHLKFARTLAGDDVRNLSLHGLSFSKFFHSAQDGPFDVVAMTGTWSWVPEFEQRNILNFLQHAMRQAGIFCHDNMVLPGNSASSALRQILTAFATFAPPEEPGNPDRALPAVQKAIELMDTNPQFMNLFADSRETLELLSKETPHHLSHEYLNHTWTARYFIETARMMHEASLDFASSWSLSQSSNNLQFTKRQVQFLESIQDVVLREQVKDYMQCRSIRYDMWSRGNPHKFTRQVVQRLEDTRLIAAKPLKDFSWVASGSAGDFDLDRTAFGLVVEKLSQGEPASLGELKRLCGSLLADDDLIMLVAVLIDNTWVRIVQPDTSDIDTARAACRAVNSRIMSLQAQNHPIRALASPVTGSGIEVPPQHLGFLRARQAGASSPAEYAEFAAAEHLQEQNNIAKQTPEFFLPAAREFEDHALPLYQKLLVD